MEKLNGISFAFAVLLVKAFGLIAGVTGRGPIMMPKEDVILIQEGDALRISCWGQGPIQFSTQIITATADQSNFTIMIDELTGTYTFYRPITMRADTGWYACAEEGIHIQNDEQTIEHPTEEITWIYVYVNSSEPFAVMEALYDMIQTVVGGHAVIPCRPTSPDLKIILYSDSSQGPIPEQPRYDPKIGFIIDNVEKTASGDNFQCVPRGSEESVPSMPHYAFHVADPQKLENPVISQENLGHIVWGQDLTLYCRINIASGERFGLTWKSPLSLPTNRYVIRQAKLIDNSKSKHTWETELTIYNVEPGDEGNYTCVAKHVFGKPVETTQEIAVWDPNYKYVNVSVEGEKYLVESQTKSVQWNVLIDTFPIKFNVHWYTEDHSEILSSSDQKSDSKNRFSLVRPLPNGKQHIFRISDLHIEDTGNYIVEVSTSYNNTSIVLPLTVIGVPIMHLYDTKPYYVPGQIAISSCLIEGSPLPNVTWDYIEYPDFPSKENSSLIQISNFETRKVEKSRFRLKSVSNITINMTGDLICRACNEVNCTESTHPIFVFDVNGFFAIEHPEIVTEGDDISVTCGASVYNFTENINWKLNAGVDSNRSHVIHRTTRFTSQSILRIKDVKISDSGDYSCEAENTEGRTETLVYQLKVEKIQAPILETNMNDSEIYLDLKKNKNLAMTLECYAYGRPVPKLSWHKNKELIVESKQYKFSENNSVLHIAYFLDGDSGRYYCNASNRVEDATSYMDIKIAGKSQPQNNVLWISLICVLIVIIVIVITYMAIRVHRERVLRKELLEAGLTHFEEGALECLNPDLTVDDQAELLPYDKKWEFPRELLKLGKQLGSGAFGVVMKAEARGICVEGEVTTVAVKMVRRSADPSYMKALSSELKIMIHLGQHLNVVNLLGACTKTILTKRELYVIVEYCRYGNLHNYLQRHRANFINQIDSATQKIDPNIGLECLVRSGSVGSQNRLKYAALSFSRSISVRSSDSNSGNELVDYRQGSDFVDINMSPDGGVLSNNSVQPGWRSNYRGDYKDQNLKPICTQDLLCWAWQVSRGMEYLSSRNVLHGDLAARNILLADDNIVKICDFGLAKNMYKDDNYKKKGDGPLPIKWMAIESIRDRIFSTQSDIWSFGIVLWEFFTLARTPYPGMEAEKQYDRLIEGYRMEKPEYATDEIYELMLHCWKGNPSLRPTFPELAEKFGTMLTESIKLHYLDLNTPYLAMNTAALGNGQNDYLTMMSSPNHDYHNSPDGVLEVHRPDSAYLSMSPSNKTSEPGILSPRSELEESHFSFPSVGKNSPINSDSEDCVEAVPMLTTEDPYLKPIDVQQRRAEFVKQSRQQTPIERDSGYCNVTSNLNISNLNHDSSEFANNYDKKLDANVLKKNNNDLMSPIIHGADNYVNMPQQKNDRLKDTVDSFSNPSYVMMAKSENNREFV